jgi:hypothetical protein
MTRSISVPKMIAVLALSAALAGCENMNNRQQRTLSGAAIGAGAGAVLGAATVGDPLAGAAVGGAAGAVVGNVTH